MSASMNMMEGLRSETSGLATIQLRAASRERPIRASKSARDGRSREKLLFSSRRPTAATTIPIAPNNQLRRRRAQRGFEAGVSVIPAEDSWAGIIPGAQICGSAVLYTDALEGRCEIREGRSQGS